MTKHQTSQSEAKVEAGLDLMFQALADPTRRAMVERLCDGPASVSDLAAPFAMALPTVLQHLKMLEASGLVISEKQGRVRSCRLAPEAMTAAEKWFGERRRLWAKRFVALDAFLADQEKN